MKKVDHQIAALLLRLAGFVFLGSSLLCSPWLVGMFAPAPPLDLQTAGAIAGARTKLFLIGIAVIAFAEVVGPGRTPRLLGRLFDRPIATKLLTSFLVLFVPLTVAEIGLRPFTVAGMKKKTTTLFVRDSDLGWRLRPGVRAPWGGVVVNINSRGLRGPEIPHSRNASKPRILYLGDSVTFGYGLSQYYEAYPFCIEALLEEELGRDVETVNAGVGGYSPWQECLFLEREGLKYQPDVVVLGFVLNDVTDKLELVRFGGDSIGYQLSQSYFSWHDWLQHNSALYSLIQRLNAKRRFGTDVRKGAVAYELATVEDLARSPESPKVRKAWSLTLTNLQDLVAVCQDHKIPLAVVVFPFRFQLHDPGGLGAPQHELKSFCERNDVPCLDLLPLLGDFLQSEEETPELLFFDDDHLSVRGGQVVAQMVVAWLRSEQTLWSHITQENRN